jgi:hypothetical protein
MKIIKYLLIAVIAVIGSINCFAQQNAASKFQFNSVNNIGLMEGEAGSVFQLQTINGFQRRSWFAGVGVGLDYYRFRSIPLFIDLRKEFGKKEDKFFLYTDGGINFYWKENKDVKQFFVNDKFKNGFYAETGFGYKFRLNKKLFLNISAGYSYKKLTEEGNYYPYNYYNPYGPYNLPPDVSAAKIVYNLNRLVLKVGVEF